jgi:hypothetical protein
MHKVKASDIISLRKALADAQPEVLEQVRARMPDELRAVLDRAVASTWLPEPQVHDIYEHFARALFPRGPSPFLELGRHMALLSYRGVYRVFLAIPSTTFVLSKAASVWASYHSTGKAAVEDVKDHAAVFVVRGAEPISKDVLDVATGHMLALAELTGAKDPVVHPNHDDPSELRWSLRWR